MNLNKQSFENANMSSFYITHVSRWEIILARAILSYSFSTVGLAVLRTPKYRKLHSLDEEGRRLEWRLGSLVPLFLFLLSLNMLDISLTNPSREGNPFTLYSWASVGILPSALMKVGLVLFFGVLCAIARRVASPVEWSFAGRLLRVILIGLIAFYVFVVTWNLILLMF